MTLKSKQAQLTTAKLELIDPQAVQFNNMTLVIAREKDKNTDKLYYNVRIDKVEISNELLEYTGWCELNLNMYDKDEPDKEVLRVLGSSLISLPSSIAILPETVDAPFCVYSDNQYITLFRLSKYGTLYVDRFMLLKIKAESSDNETEQYRLDRIWETRYRNSKNKIVPADEQDMLGYTDLLDQAFLEPTLELVNLPKLESGSFAVELLTGKNIDEQRWYFFLIVDNHVQVCNWKKSTDGLFDFDKQGDSFSFQSCYGDATLKLNCIKGLAAKTVVYSQKEKISGKNTTPSSLRLMLAVPVQNTAVLSTRALAIYDFGILPDGQIPAISNKPSPIPSPIISSFLDGEVTKGTFIPKESAFYPIPKEAVLIVQHDAEDVIPLANDAVTYQTTVYHYLLGSVQAKAATNLVNSDDGLVHCYYPSLADEFLVAQFDPEITRPLVKLETKNTGGKLNLIAKRSGTSLNNLNVAVCSSSGNDDLCEVLISYNDPVSKDNQSKPDDHWLGVPRDMTSFAKILNMEASSEIANKEVQNGSIPFYDYSNTYYLVRLKFNAIDSLSWLTLVSTRTDLVLDSAVIDSVENKHNFNLNFRFITDEKTDDKIVTLKWNNIHTDLTKFRSIIRGDAALETYPYTHDDQVLGIKTEAGGDILVFVAKDKAITKPKIIIVSGNSSTTLKVTISFTLANESKQIELEVSNVVTEFAKKLLDHEQIKEIMPVISVSKTHLSDDNNQEKVKVQTSEKLLDLRELATLFGSLPATSETASIATGSYAASKLHGLIQGDTKVNPLYTLTIISQPSDGKTAIINDQSKYVAKEDAGSNGKWRAAKPLYALNFNGKSAMKVSSELSPNFNELAPKAEFTFETWLIPESEAESRLVSFKGSQKNTKITPQYFVNIRPWPCLKLVQNTDRTKTKESYIKTQPDARLNPDQEFTVEIWIKPFNGTDGVIFQLTNETTTDYINLELRLKSISNKSIYNLEISTEDTKKQTLSLFEPELAGILDNTWTHVAVTANCTDKINWLLKVYINGEDCNLADSQRKKNNTLKKIQTAKDTKTTLSIGGYRAGKDTPYLMEGSYTELRYWNIQRTQMDISRSFENFLTKNEAETEDNLVLYWRLLDPLPESKLQFKDKAIFVNNSKLEAILDGEYNLNYSVHPAVQKPQGMLVDLTAGIGDAPVQKTTYMHTPLKSWDHVAVTYKAGTGVQLDGKNNFINGGVNNSFNFTDKFTLECWIQAESSTQQRCLISKWADDVNQQSYWLGINASGQLYFQTYFVITTTDDQGNDKKEGKLFTYTLTKKLENKVYHIVVSIELTYKKDDPSKKELSNISHTAEAFIYINGEYTGPISSNITSGVKNTTIVTIQETKSPLLIGATHKQSTEENGKTKVSVKENFNGKITGVILSSTKLDQTYATESYSKRSTMERKNAVVSWWFTEQSGMIAKDSNSSLAAKLSDNTLWAIFEHLSKITLNVNGQKLTATDASEDYSLGETPQFTLGGLQKNSELLLPFSGKVNETRIWGRALSSIELMQKRFTPLNGNESDLLGYWNFNDQKLNDSSSNNNHGENFIATLKFELSTAPVSNEDPAVRNVFGEQKTKYHQKLIGTPAIVEFTNSDKEVSNGIGNLRSTLERAYFYTSRFGEINLMPGFFIGLLDKIYMGQIQSQPELIGFIEGSPPVPSENLTCAYYDPDFAGDMAGRFNYFNASSISFYDIESTSTSYAISYDYNGTYEHTNTIGGWYATDTAVGLGVVQKTIVSEMTAGVREKGYVGSSYLKAQNSISTWTVSSSDNLSLRGNWEPADKVLNPVVGRRFLPDNIGYALVKSLTVDVYLLINSTTGTAKGQVVLPNPDIPLDHNIIHFKINPGYIKNGTLDGKVGLYNDPDYSNADIVRGSYFKPKEAYKLKDQINKKNTELQGYYKQYNEKLTALSTQTLEALGQKKYRLIDRSDTPVAKQGIVNTYVWTASGGMHTEQQEFSDVYTETYTGGYELNQQFGAVSNFKFSPAVLVEAEHLGGWKIDIKNEKSKTSSSNLGLNVEVNGESFLGWHGKDDKGNYYSEQPIPGKVNSYRFNTFYLPPDADNTGEFFNKVVDKVWLRSNDPDAIALRSVNKTSQSWRVLHRVTYVNRVPPNMDDLPTQSLAQPKTQISDLYNNRFIVDLVLDLLGDLSTATSAKIGEKVLEILYPESKATTSKLGKYIFWWDNFVKSTETNAENYTVLHSIQRNIINYLAIGIAEGDITATPKK